MEAFNIKYPINMTKLHKRRCNNLDIDQEIIRTNLLETMPCQYDQYTYTTAESRSTKRRHWK